MAFDTCHFGNNTQAFSKYSPDRRLIYVTKRSTGNQRRSYSSPLLSLRWLQKFEPTACGHKSYRPTHRLGDALYITISVLMKETAQSNPHDVAHTCRYSCSQNMLTMRLYLGSSIRSYGFLLCGTFPKDASFLLVSVVLFLSVQSSQQNLIGDSIVSTVVYGLAVTCSVLDGGDMCRTVFPIRICNQLDILQRNNVNLLPCYTAMLSVYSTGSRLNKTRRCWCYCAVSNDRPPPRVYDCKCVAQPLHDRL